MSLIFVEGDLLDSDCTMILHQANCFSTMGAGIAKEIARRYPSVYLADVNYKVPKGSLNRLGHWSGAVVKNNTTGLDQLVVNMYGQYGYGKGLQTNYDALSWALTRALWENRGSLGKVGVPYNLGCGYAGGDWNIVSNILKDLSDVTGVDIYVYRLRGAL